MAVTLVEAIANLKHYGEREASAIFTQALHELSQLHHAGYVHLNITPQSLLVSQDSTLKWKVRLAGGGKFARLSVPLPDDSGSVFRAPELAKVAQLEEAGAEEKAVQPVVRAPSTKLFCTKCGTKFLTNGQFCTKCGAPREPPRVGVPTTASESTQAKDRVLSPTKKSRLPDLQKADVWALGVTLYYSLLGSYPWPEGDEERDVDWEEQSLKQLSLQAQDLLQNMLAVDPKLRYSLDECVHHCWISHPKFLPDVALENAKSNFSSVESGTLLKSTSVRSLPIKALAGLRSCATAYLYDRVSREQFADVHGPHAIVRPIGNSESLQAVLATMSASHSLNFRSGFSARSGAVNAVVSPTANPEVVINLSQFNTIEFGENEETVTLGCAVTFEKLVAKLIAKQRKPQPFLPIPALIHRTRTIVPCLLSKEDDPSFFENSLPPLKSRVVSYQSVKKNGSQVLARQGEEFGLDPDEVIHTVTLSTQSAGLENLAVAIVGSAFDDSLSDLVFDLLNTNWGPNHDLQFAVTQCYRSKYFYVTVTGFDDVGAKLKAVLKSHQRSFPMEVFKGPESLHALKGTLSTADAWSGSIADASSPDSIAQLRRLLKQAAKEDLSSPFVLQTGKSNRLFVLAPESFSFTSTLDQSARGLVSAALRRVKPSPLEASSDEWKAANRRATLTVRSVMGAAAAPSVIPNFKGEVYDASDKEYTNRITHYAQEYDSYDKQIKDKRMRPKYVCYPQQSNIDDVIAAVQFAVNTKLNAVAVSGGHQYCGLSSGGSDTLLISFEKWDKLGTPYQDTSGAWRWTIQPGAKLINLADQEKATGLFFPHGECPYVCLGGHVQSGGYGHIMRSFGIAADHVYELEMVVVERDSQGRPVAKARKARKDIDSLFACVLGGGPGAFGIITSITMAPMADTKYPDSASLQIIRPIFFAKGFELCLEEQRNLIAREDINADIFLTVYQPSLVVTVTGLLIEVAAKDEAGREYLEAALKRMSSQMWIGFPTKLEKRPLSMINYNGVRRELITLNGNGREYSLPYIKRLNCSNLPLTDRFIKDFPALVNENTSAKGIYFVVQITCGGNAYRTKGDDQQQSLIAHRDTMHLTVFDTFYKYSWWWAPNARGTAQDLQDQFQKQILPNYVGRMAGNKPHEVRMQWGTFGSEADITMSNPYVQEYYYGAGGSNTSYNAIKDLKIKYDPFNVFQTQFTVNTTAPANG